MPSASWSLQKAIYSGLQANTVVTGLLGGQRIFDDVPQRTELPYLTLGQSTVSDWSTGTDAGTEHVLTIHAWSRADGRREAHELMEAVRSVLHDAPLALEGHVLVNLLHERSEARREPDGETIHGIVRLRAVTEPA